MARRTVDHYLGALELEWEVKLRDAGEHPPEIRLLIESCESDGLHVVDFDCTSSASNVREDQGIADHPTSIYWRDFADRVRRLPPTYNIYAKAFLTVYAECGSVVDARKIVDISKQTAFNYLEAFENPKKEQSK